MRKGSGKALLASGAVTLALGVLVPSPAFAHDQACPEGWTTQGALGPNDPFDQNGNGIICTKDIPGEGSGNSSRRAGSEEVGHVPGHNHKDDHTHA